MPHGFGASSRLAHRTALVFGEHYCVCDGFYTLAAGSIGWLQEEYGATADGIKTFHTAGGIKTFHTCPFAGGEK